MLASLQKFYSFYNSQIEELEEESTDTLDIATEEKDSGEDISKKSPTLSTTFNPNNTRSIDELRDLSKSFEEFVRKKENRTGVRELGFSSIKEMIEFINNPLNELPNISTITDQESFDSLIETIKRCR